MHILRLLPAIPVWHGWTCWSLPWLAQRQAWEFKSTFLLLCVLSTLPISTFLLYCSVPLLIQVTIQKRKKEGEKIELIKHIEVSCHFIGEKVEPGFVSTPVRSKVKLANVLTKILLKDQLQSTLRKLGTININVLAWGVALEDKGLGCNYLFTVLNGKHAKQ